MKFLSFLIISSLIVFGCNAPVFAKCSNPVVNTYFEVVDFPSGFKNIYSPYTCVKAPDRALESEIRVLFSFKVDVQKGDFIEAIGFVGVTNPMPKPMAVWRNWVLSKSPSGVTGINGSRSIGRNITPGMHHDTLHDIGHWSIEESGTFYLNFLVTAASGEKRLFNEYIVIDKGYSNFLIKRD